MRVRRWLLVINQMWLLTPSSSSSTSSSLRGGGAATTDGADASEDVGGSVSASADDHSAVAAIGDGMMMDEEEAAEIAHFEKPRARIRRRDAEEEEEEAAPPSSLVSGSGAAAALNNNGTDANSGLNRFHRDERGEDNMEGMIFQKRIIGGRASATNAHTFTVSLQDRHGTHFCGGSLVSKDVVLTAAHCTSRVTGKGPITIVIGRHALSDVFEGEALQVRYEKIHPRYDVTKANTEWKYDFALLWLQRPTMTRAEIVRLNSDPRIPRGGALVSVHGWGDTHKSDNVRIPADELQVANLRIVSNEQCDAMTGVYGQYSVSFHGFIHEDMMCAKNRKRDSCQGDSGGPLTFRDEQVGLTSWGVGCNNRSFPGVYARVSTAYEWIRRNVCSRSMFPDSQFDCEPW